MTQDHSRAVARPSAHPVRGRKLPGGRVADRLSRPPAQLLAMLDAMPPAAAADPRAASGRHLVLVTRRRSGARVATPVWAAEHEGVLYVRTQRASGKVKRLRRDGAVSLAVCTPRGKPLSAAVPGRARLLETPEEEVVAEHALRRRYGTVRAVCAAVQDRLRVDMCYLAVTVDAPAS